jgi:PST family polysaccharide transporter/lipopolysaccharide exporter
VSLSRILRRIKEVLIPGEGTEERIIKSGAWSGATNTLNRIIQLVKLVILARFLPPSEFGLIGIAFLTITAAGSFTDLGIQSALIQKKEENINEYLSTAWTVRAIRGIVLSVILFFAAPYVAAFFDEPRAANVVRVIALSPLILGFRNIGIVYFTKNLEFHKRFAQELSGTAVNFSIAVVLGITLQNVWALVLGSLGGNLTSLVVSYLLHNYRPRIEFDRSAARELINYGKWIFGDSVITFLVNQGDDAFVGWFLNATSLGFYQMAYRFSNAPATEITSVISGVAFPSYSQVQTDIEKLRNGFYRTIRVSSFISFPAAVGIMAVAPSFVRGLLGEEWIPIIPVMQLLAVWGLLRSINAASTPVFNATGRPDITTKIRAASLLVIVILIFPAAARYELVGIAAVLIISSLFVSVPAWTYIAVRSVDGSILQYLRILSYPLIGSGLMGGIVWTVQQSVTSGIVILDFLGLVLLGGLVYAGFTACVVKVLDYRIDAELRSIITHFRS